MDGVGMWRRIVEEAQPDYVRGWDHYRQYYVNVPAFCPVQVEDNISESEKEKD
jgi:hypothetical protein